MEDLIGNIRRTYESHEGSITPFLWLQDFPFGPDIYTRLSMDSQEKNARETATPKVVEMTKIFESHEECKQTKKVLIEGKPGIGKTTLCNKIAYDWATKKHGGDDCFPQFESILLLKCRDVGVESNVWEAIGDQLLPREVQRDQREDFFEFIRRNQSKVLLVLDGLDELPPSKLPEFTDIIQGRMLPRCHLVVTARHEAGILVKKVCYTLIEIEGFTLEDAFEFITKFFKGKEELVQGRLDKLENDSSLQEMTANPLNTVLLCLLCEDLQGVLPENRTQLYLEIVQCVLIRYRKRKAPPVDKENMVELHKEQLSHLGSIALDCLYEDQVYFGANQLANQHTKLPGFGALSAQPGSKRRPSLWYSFTHKCFHEFLAGRFVCCHLASKQTSPEMFFTGTKFFRELRQVLHFTCGLLAVSSEESLVALINGVANEGNKKDTEERLLVALERMKECRKGGSDFLTQLARSFGSSLKAHKVDLSDKRMDKAGAAVLGLTLETNTTLTQLNMSGNNLGPVGAESLATALKRNTKFNLSGKNLGSTVVRSIAVALEMNKHLTELNLSTNQLGPAGAESLAVALKTNTTPTVLYLSGNNLGPAGAESLAAALKANSTVTQLNLSYNNIGPVGANSLAVALETIATLTDLSLLNNALGPAGAESLATALRTNATLTDLYLYDNKLGPGGAKSLAAVLETNKSLTSLDLSHNYLGPADAESLAATLKRNSTLTDLNLLNNDLGPVGAESLAAALKRNTALTKFHLSGNNLGSTGVKSIAVALEMNKHLTESNLSTNQLGPAGAESLAVALKTNTTLTVLYLSGNNLGPAGAESLAAALKANSTVTQLNLSYNNIGPVGANSLAVALETIATLTDLSLLNNALGPAGAESLATALRTNATLTDLYLYDNKLGPGGAKSLAAVLETNKSLTSLDLSHNYLGPADAESLAATLKRNSTLTDLNLFNNDLGPAGTGSLATTLTTNTTLKKLNLSRNNLSPEDTESLATALKTNTSLTKLVL